MKPFEQRACAVIKRLSPDAIMAEVGVLLGTMSEFMLSNRKDIVVLMIDNWQTADKQPEAYKATGDAHANHTDKSRVQSHRTQAEARARKFPNRARIVPLASTEAAATIKDGTLDLVFLDADHSYPGVKGDLAAWVPKIKPGGWIGGHDYRNKHPAYDFSGVDRAVEEWAIENGHTIETDENFTWFVRIGLDSNECKKEVV